MCSRRKTEITGARRSTYRYCGSCLRTFLYVGAHTVIVIGSALDVRDNGGYRLLSPYSARNMLLSVMRGCHHDICGSLSNPFWGLSLNRNCLHKHPLTTTPIPSRRRYTLTCMLTFIFFDVFLERQY